MSICNICTATSESLETHMDVLGQQQATSCGFGWVCGLATVSCPTPSIIAGGHLLLNGKACQTQTAVSLYQGTSLLP